MGPNLLRMSAFGIHFALFIIILALAGCGGGGGGGGGGTGSGFSIGGSLAGIATGKTIVLQNNGGDDLSLNANGTFTFATTLNDGATYAVTVLTEPAGFTCTVTNGTGTVSGATVTDIVVTCVGQPADHFVISGNAAGTLSIMRKNDVAGYATAMAYYPVTSSDTIVDMAYDSTNQRLFVLDGDNLHVLGWDNDEGITQIDVRPTSISNGNNSSHLVLNADASAVYVATGSSSSSFVDLFTVRTDGTLNANDPTAITVDPD